MAQYFNILRQLRTDASVFNLCLSSIFCYSSSSGSPPTNAFHLFPYHPRLHCRPGRLPSPPTAGNAPAVPRRPALLRPHYTAGQSPPRPPSNLPHPPVSIAGEPSLHPFFFGACLNPNPKSMPADPHPPTVRFLASSAVSAVASCGLGGFVAPTARLAFSPAASRGVVGCGSTARK
jgi:hypothetical protein